MSRLIDADALIERMRKYIDGDWHRNLGAVFTHGVEACINMAELAPTIEAVPVVHGEWVLLDECSNAGVYCSVCHKKVYRKDYANQKVKSKWCPNCGADMRKGGAE